MVHKLKTWPEFFGAIREDIKRFEIRKDDRGFKVGDYLLLQEYDIKNNRYTGEEENRQITYILSGPAFGLEKDYVCMSLE
jgi:hypothetical protein